MNNRRKLTFALGAGVVAAPLVCLAQKKPAKVYRIGVLHATNSIFTQSLQEALRQGLRDHGYVEGQNIIVERRFAEGKVERMSDIAAELVRNKMDVILAGSDTAIVAVRQETRSIPIVMVASIDPVGTGFIASLARPGGNVTGLSQMSSELSAKRLELLSELVPSISRVAFLWNPDIRGTLFEYKETEGAARALRVQLFSVELRRAQEIERAFSTVIDHRVQGLIVQTPNLVVNENRALFVALAQKYRLPAIYGFSDLVDAGGLLSYASNGPERWRRAASYVDKILKGANPADLPVEQPTKFELVINMKTAKALGIAIPQTILVRADRVIQ
jgi:putative ABC transport system substrate-binding protein